MASENEERKGIKKKKQRFVASQQPLEENGDLRLRNFDLVGGQVERES
jgi:hypothetical protein